MEEAQRSYIGRTSGLKAKDYFGYALGDVAGCLVFSLVSTLLQKYYTDILYLDPLFIMIMMIVARVWDAINDPMMGRIADTRKTSKWGRYRPWLLYVSVPLGVSAILMFIWWPGLDYTINPWLAGSFATITYVLFGMTYTVHQIPYGSLASVVTTDEKERSKLSMWRSIGAALGSLPVILITLFCYKNRTDASGNPVIGENGKVIQDMQYAPVIISVIVMALLCTCLLLLAFKLNKERTVPTEAPKKEKGATKRIIKTLLKSRPFLSLSVASMLLLAGQMFMQSYYLYLFNDFFGRNIMNLLAQACTYGPMILWMPFLGKLNKKFGKKEVCAAGALLSAVANLAMFACQPVIKDAWWLYLVLCFFSGCGLSVFVLQVWSLATDAIDDLEVRTGQKEDGSAYSVFMFFRKLGQVIAAVAVNGALLGMNYKTYKGAVQSVESLNLMYILSSIIPACIFGAMALVLWLWYPLSKKQVAELQVKKEANLKAQIEANKIAVVGEDGLVNTGSK